MTYSDFLNTVAFLVRQHLPEGVTPELTSVLKNNGIRKDALILRADDSKVAPTIYLEGFYDSYLGGKDLSLIAREIALTYENSLPDESPDISFFEDYDRVKEFLALKLINYDRNSTLLKEVPYRRFLDLAVVCYCLLRESKEGSATVLIKSSHLSHWGIHPDTLFSDAKKNSEQMLSSEISDMNVILREAFGQAELTPEGHLYVLSNRLKLNGASCILYDDILSDFAEEINSGFYVLPSSIHEVILLPEKTRTDSEEMLSHMVSEINRTEVPETDILSDHAYYYDASEHRMLCL